MQTIESLKKYTIDFVRTDIWRFRLDDLPFKKSFFIRQLRIIILSFRGFTNNNGPLRASALTFYSLLSIVPVAAMAFGIAKGFGFEKHLQKQLIERFPGQEEIVHQVINFAHSLLENTKGGAMAVIGLLALFWAVIKVLSHIEGAFNHIWEIKRARTFSRKFSDYISIMLVCPILVIMSGSITVFITTQVMMIMEKTALLGAVSFIIYFLLKLVPYFLIWLLFTLVYLIMPNTKVKFRSGFIGGIIAGTIYQLIQWGYIDFQVGVARYNAIYGSFAALPLFLIWLQLSWMTVIFGAEVTFAHQNVDTYEFEPDCLLISDQYKELLTLQVIQLVVVNFSKGVSPLTAEGISKTLRIPIRLVNQIIFTLENSGLISNTRSENEREPSWQPSVDINLLTVNYVVDAINQKGVDDIPVAETRELTELEDTLRTFHDLIKNSPSNKLLKDI